MPEQGYTNSDAFRGGEHLEFLVAPDSDAGGQLWYGVISY
jgi:hypothetical protein